MIALGLSGCAVLSPAPVRRAPASPRAYVTNNLEGAVAVVDTAERRVVASIPIPNPTGRWPFPAFVAAAADGARVYVANLNGASITEIDTAANAVVRTIPLTHPPRGLALTPDGRKLYVAGDGNEGFVIDTDAGEVVATIRFEQAGFDVQVARDGTRAYFTLAEGALAEVDVANDEVVFVLGGLVFPSAVALHPRKRIAYVLSNTDLGDVTVVDLATRAVAGTIRVDMNPVAAALSDDGRRLYVANRGSGTLSVVDTDRGEVLAGVAVGTVPHGVALSADGREAYVTASGSDALVVVSTETFEVLATVRMSKPGARPLGVVVVGGAAAMR